MKILLLASTLVAVYFEQVTGAGHQKDCTVGEGNIYEYEAQNLQLKPIKFDQFRGQVLLIINLATF